jgi:hypothetical protein
LTGPGLAGGPDRVVIPQAYHDLSTRRVLVMQRLDGEALAVPPEFATTFRALSTLEAA